MRGLNRHSVPCPACGGGTGCTDVRPRQDGVTRRRRECHECSYRFTTYERMEPPTISLEREDAVGVIARLSPEHFSAAMKLLRALPVEEESTL